MVGYSRLCASKTIHFGRNSILRVQDHWLNLTNRVYASIFRYNKGENLVHSPTKFFSIQPKYGTTVKSWALLANPGKLVQYYFEIPVFGAWLGPISGKLVQTNYQRWMSFSRNWADSCLEHLPIRVNWMIFSPSFKLWLMSRFGLSLENFGKKLFDIRPCWKLVLRWTSEHFVVYAKRITKFAQE